MPSSRLSTVQGSLATPSVHTLEALNCNGFVKAGAPSASYTTYHTLGSKPGLLRTRLPVAVNYPDAEHRGIGNANLDISASGPG